MRLLREVSEGAPVIPEGGWNVGHLANLGVLLSCDGFSIRLDLDNLNKLFDYAEDDTVGTVRDHSGKTLDVRPYEDGIILTPHDDPAFPNGIVLDLDALEEMGIEAYEEVQADEPDSEYDELPNDDTIEPTDDEGDEQDVLPTDETVEEGIKQAFRRKGKKIVRGFRVTSGFRKGRVVSSASGAFKPRKSAATRMKMKIAARKKRVIRVLKGKRTRRKPTSRRLVRMNKRVK